MEVTDYIEDFIDYYYEDVYNEYSDVYPEEIHSDWTLEDAHDLDEFVLDHMSYEFNEFLRKKGYGKMITVDKQCRDILANQWLHNTEDGKHITEQYKKKKISKAEYLDYIYKQTDVWIDMLESDELASFLCKQEYFDFNVDKQLLKLSEDNHAAFIVEPSLIRRVDDEGNHHYVLDSVKKPNDVVLKYLPLNPDKFQLLLNKLEQLNLYSMGLNWLRKPDSPTIIIFGIQSYCEELYERLKKTYGINS